MAGLKLGGEALDSGFTLPHFWLVDFVTPTLRLAVVPLKSVGEC